MGYVILSDGFPISVVNLHGNSSQIGSRIGYPYNEEPIVFESRLEADLLAAFLSVSFPWCGPVSIHETVKVVPAPKEV